MRCGDYSDTTVMPWDTRPTPCRIRPTLMKLNSQHLSCYWGLLSNPLVAASIVSPDYPTPNLCDELLVPCVFVIGQHESCDNPL